jgi:hypothetical protein
MDAESQGTVSGRKNGNNEDPVIRSNEEEWATGTVFGRKNGNNKELVALGSTSSESKGTVTPEQEILNFLKKEHDLAKAVKSDDASVPEHLWDFAVCLGEPSAE